jgi:hypothetical protein
MLTVFTRSGHHENADYSALPDDWYSIQPTDHWTEDMWDTLAETPPEQQPELLLHYCTNVHKGDDGYCDTCGTPTELPSTYPLTIDIERTDDEWQQEPDYSDGASLSWG